MKKIHLLTITAALFMALTQISCNGGGQEFTDSSNIGTQSTQVGATTGGDDDDVQSKYFQENSTQEGPFGFGILYRTIAATWKGDDDLPVYMDWGLIPAAVPDNFTDILQVSPDDYILYPQTNYETRFVQYSYAEGAENDELIGDFVDGDLSPVDTLDDFQEDQIVIVCFGGTYNNHAYASVTINFGTSTWSGIFLGAYNVAVSGSIEGQFFYSETITEFNNSDILVNGMITGSFYGPEADDIAGLIDITRNGERLIDLFDAQKVDINTPTL